MKITLALLALAALTTACHKSPADKRADQQAADARTGELDNYSNLLDARAKRNQDNSQQGSDTGDATSDNIAASVP